MAQYRFSPDIVSRGKGQSVIAKAAYNAREDIRDERTGEVKRYGHREGLEFSGIFAPKNAPAWMQDRAKLWNAVELQEDGTTRRKSAQLARSLELSLPHELNADQRKQLVRDFVREQFVRQGMVADVAIHRPDTKGDQRNYHAHILVTLREIDGDGFSAEKARQWNDKKLNLQWREKWAELGARYLANAGHSQEAERYSYGHFDKEKQHRIALERGDHEHAQTLEGLATTHKGPQLAAMERRLEITSERSHVQQEVFAAAQETAKLKRELAEVQKQIADETERLIQAQERGNTGGRPVSPRWHFEDAAREATDTQPIPGVPSTLRGTAAEVWKAYNHRPAERDPRNFVTALHEKGIEIARVSKDEADRSHRAAAFAKEVGNYIPVYGDGEFVAVNRRGDVYKLTERNTGAPKTQIQERLQKAELKGLYSIEGTRSLIQTREIERNAERQTRREAYSEAQNLKASTKTTAQIISHAVKRVANDNIRAAGSTVHRAAAGANKAINIGGSVLSVLSNAIESLFAPPKPLTRAEAAEERKRQRAAANDQDRAFEHYARETEYDRAQARRHDEARKQQIEREQYERLERGGRER